MLELPRTIRDLEVVEIPSGDVAAVMERLRLKSEAKIIEGYKLLKNNEKSELPFSFYSEININNSRLFYLFIGLCNLLPKTVALIFGFYGDDLNYGIYTDRNDIIEELKKYKREIIEDCDLELGLINQTESQLTEVFINECKYVKFWGTDEKSFRELMDDFELEEVNDIEFIDEYPKVVVPLKSIDESAMDSYEILLNLKDKFIK
jgi:hypothetical protein